MLCALKELYETTRKKIVRLCQPSLGFNEISKILNQSPCEEMELNFDTNLHHATDYHW